MGCKTSSLVRRTSCGLPTKQQGKWFFQLSISTQYLVPPETAAMVGVNPYYHPATNQGSKSCVHFYQSFEPVNSWVSTIIFTKITLLLRVCLTLQKTTVWFVALQIPCVLPKVYWKVKQPSKNTFVLELCLVKGDEVKLYVFKQWVLIGTFF